MCGIAGSYSAGFTQQIYDVVSAIVQSQFARGPDHQAIEKIITAQSALVLGHNRLSVLDLSGRANQPMWDSSNQYCIVYNGEIYNYVELRAELTKLGHIFATTSDTEVILNSFKQWGISALNRFNGPFAFALYDASKKQLWLVRDRFGIKPLYYFLKNDVLYFASSSNALASYFCLNPNLDFVARGLYSLVYENDNDETHYRDMFSLAPGHHLKVEIASSGILSYEIKKYYDLQTRVTSLTETVLSSSIPEMLGLLVDRLNQAVSIRLRADVPIGIALSGGLDSSSIAALVAEQHNNIIGFTFGHPTAKKSEGPLVNQLANKLNFEIEYIWPTTHEILQTIPKVVQAQDSPFGGMSVVAQYMVYQKVNAAGIKVLLGGQGGDEGFMGYRKYQVFWLQQLLRQKRYHEALMFSLQLIPLVLSEINQAKQYWQQRARYFKGKAPISSLCLPRIQPPFLGLTKAGIRQRQVMDVTKYSLPTLLRYEDRNSMANSVESRLPFMDYTVIELGVALPEALKLAAGYGKWAVREIMQGKIPETIRAARYKRGFDVSMPQLIAAGLGQAIRDQLEGHYAKIRDFLTPRVRIAELFSDQQFLQSSAKVPEAIALLWLGRCYT